MAKIKKNPDAAEPILLVFGLRDQGLQVRLTLVKLSSIKYCLCSERSAYIITFSARSSESVERSLAAVAQVHVFKSTHQKQ